jgi:hypothetical protein
MSTVLSLAFYRQEIHDLGNKTLVFDTEGKF